VCGIHCSGLNDWDGRISITKNDLKIGNCFSVWHDNISLPHDFQPHFEAQKYNYPILMHYFVWHAKC